VLNDGKLQVEVMKQEPRSVEAALSHAIKLEAFEQSLAFQGTLVNHNDGHAMHQPCSVCAVTGPSEVGQTAAFRELIEDVQNTLEQAMRGMAALAKGLWSGRTTPSEVASSAGSIPDAVSTLPVLAPRHTSLGQPGRGGGGCGCGDHRPSRV